MDVVGQDRGLRQSTNDVPRRCEASLPDGALLYAFPASRVAQLRKFLLLGYSKWGVHTALARCPAETANCGVDARLHTLHLARRRREEVEGTRRVCEGAWSV